MRPIAIFFAAAVLGLTGPVLATTCYYGTRYELRLTQLSEDGAVLAPPTGMYAFDLVAEGGPIQVTVLDPTTGAERTIYLERAP